jgi:hypothetical protein
MITAVFLWRSAKSTGLWQKCQARKDAPVAIEGGSLDLDGYGFWQRYQGRKKLKQLDKDRRLLEKRRARDRDVWAAKELRQKNFAIRVGTLSCEFVPRDVKGIEGLPPNIVTLRLRFADLKRKMCKPYPK